MSQVLITASELAASLQGQRPPRVLDCRARLGDSDAGRRLWEAGHVPGSLHLDLDRDLAAAPGEGGRHPLPATDAFTASLQRLGISPSVPVVVLDDMGGQLAAARAWWMLAVWAGHPDGTRWWAALLAGGGRRAGAGPGGAARTELLETVLR